MSRAFLVFCAATSLVGMAPPQTNTWSPAAGLEQTKIWPGEVPDAKPAAGPERNVTTPQNAMPGGKAVTRVTDVVSPSITRYAPKGQNTGVAALVFPGGVTSGCPLAQQPGHVLTESQVLAMEEAKQEKEAQGEIETAHPGYLGAQDTYCVGTINSIGRILPADLH